VAGGLVAGVEVHDEDVDDLVVVEPAPVLVLGLDEPVHHVDAAAAAARRPLVGPPLVQHALQHRHEPPPRPERPVVGEPGEVDGHGAHAVVEVGVAPLQSARGAVAGAAEEDLHDDLEGHAAELREELDLLAAARLGPGAQRGGDGAVDEPQVGGERVEAVDGRGGELAQAAVLVVRHGHERLGPDQRHRGLGPAGDEGVVVHEHLLARLRGGHQDRRAAEHEGTVQTCPPEPVRIVHALFISDFVQFCYLCTALHSVPASGKKKENTKERFKCQFVCCLVTSGISSKTRSPHHHPKKKRFVEVKLALDRPTVL
jgi:hypothetical protein